MMTTALASSVIDEATGSAGKLDLLRHFVCPQCLAPLIARTETELACLKEGSHSFPLVRGVPRFVQKDEYADTFSFEWNTHNRTQLDSARNLNTSEEQFRQKTGLTPEQVRGKLVLDAGVGAGRFSDILVAWGAEVIGVDLSFAVEAAHQNFLIKQNILIAQADIGALPFAANTFDFIISMGVLHHTPDTKSYFNRLVPLLKPGGEIAIWVYPKEPDYVTRNAWIPFTNRIPTRAFYEWCRWFITTCYGHRKSNFVRWIQGLFPFSDQGEGLEFDILDLFDGYSPRFHGIHSPEEVAEWFREAGLVNIRIPGYWSTSMRGMRPL